MAVSIERHKAAWNCGLNLRTTTVVPALVIMFAITMVATPARAQTFSILHTFTGQGDGGAPAAGLTIDQAGNFYGTTSGGGAGYGTVFKLSHSGSGWILTSLYMFQGPSASDGAYPYARVLFGPDGALYGTTMSGGTGPCSDGDTPGCGTVFRLQPPNRICRSINCPWTETVLYRFTGGADGAFPGYGDLTFDVAGNVYGTTSDGGANCYPYGGCGVVFELSRAGGSWTESVIYSFSLGASGFAPYGGVTLDSSGNLYGTTTEGGANYGGVLYELSQAGSGWTETVLHAFGGPGDGSAPFGGVIMDLQGNLYGTTSAGPGQGAGTVYELQPSDGSWTYSTLADLYGFTPGLYDAPTRDAQGNLYATTFSGGGGYGNVFKLTPSGGTWTYTDLHDFDGRDGLEPVGSVALDANGNVCGTTFYANGEVWEITP